MAAAKRLPDFLSLAVTLLVLLAGAAPARVVAAELLLLGDSDRRLPGRDCLRRFGEAARGRAGHRDRTGSGGRLVLVGQRPAVLLRLLLDHRRVLRCELRMEERPDDLLADLQRELLEHPVALTAVLDERV